MRKNKLTAFLFSLLILCSYNSYSQEYITEDPFETMIRLGRMSQFNPVYEMPSGTAGQVYITSAITSGDAVNYPLGYAATSAPNKHFVIVSKTTSLVERDRAFQLIVKENTASSGQVASIYTDWNRDGDFEKVSSFQIDAEKKGFSQDLIIPADAKLGKTRIRVRFDSSEPSAPGVAVNGGRVYDFVVYVMEKTNQNDCYISVSPSNDNWGTAIIETAPKSNGRYDLNTSVTVKATPNTLVTFEGWQEGEEIVSTNLTYTFTVEKSTHLIALFKSEEPELATPKASTAENPVWYQIKNAHTAEVRADRYIAYKTVMTDDYTSELRAERPADTSDAFLWRLETTTGNKVKIINRGTDKEIFGNAVLEREILTAEENGSEFTIDPSGNANGSFSIKHNGNSGYLLNAQDGTWKLVLYNAGVGTGSGWYFYHVPITPPVNIGTIQESTFKAFLADGVVSLTGLGDSCKIKAVNLSGQVLAEFVANTPTYEYTLKYPENFIILIVQQESGEYTTLKLCNQL